MNNVLVMRKVKLEKITLNIGAGKNEDQLKKGLILLKMVTGIEPVKTYTQKRIPGWGLRPGLAIGAKITLRGQKARMVLKNLLAAKDNQLSPSSFDERGNVSFGIPEYIDIPGVSYNPEIKIMGFEVAVTLQRPGYRIKLRKVKQKRLPKCVLISSADAIQFMKDEFGVQVEEQS